VAKVQKRFAKTTLKLRVRPLLEEKDAPEQTARIQTTESTSPTGIVRQYVAARAEDAPANLDALVRKGEEYIG
jgi:hypothetical protein